jgi:hypothetical protein
VVGSQAFMSASAFDANIGAWNIAAVTDLSSVRAVLDACSMRHRRVYIYICSRYAPFRPSCKCLSAVARNAARVVRSVGL